MAKEDQKAPFAWHVPGIFEHFNFIEEIKASIGGAGVKLSGIYLQEQPAQIK